MATERAIKSAFILIQGQNGEPEKVVIRSKDGHQIFYNLVEDDDEEIMKTLNQPNHV